MGVKVVKKDEELLEKILIEKKVFKIISQNKKTSPTKQSEKEMNHSA